MLAGEGDGGMFPVGGSSGVLYGGACMAAVRTLRGKEVIDRGPPGQTLQVMAEDMCGGKRNAACAVHLKLPLLSDCSYQGT